MAKPAYMSLIDDATLQDPTKAQAKRIDLIRQIEAVTKRRLLVYIAKGDASLTPDDKTGFSDLIEGVDVDEVDILINSPGGFAEVTEAIVGMLRAKYKSVRFTVPNSAKSAATLLALSGDTILMDSRSELGPIDPQVSYMTRHGRKQEAAEAITEGFNSAKKSLMSEGPTATPAYLPLLEQYTIGLLQACHNAKKLSETLATEWLTKYMFAGKAGATEPKAIADYFGSHKETLSHGRAIMKEKCQALGMDILDLDKPENTKLRDMIWKLWCHYELHLERAIAVTKVYENSSGCMIQKLSAIIQIAPAPSAPPRQSFPPRAPGSPMPGLPGAPFGK
jgi:hypothetical protein